MRIETYHNDWLLKKWVTFSHSPVWWGLKQVVISNMVVSTFGFQPFASMMRIETWFFLLYAWCYIFLSAIRQYDEDWNTRLTFSVNHAFFFQPFASMMRIETPLRNTVTTVLPAFSHSPVWWGLKPLLSCAAGVFLLLSAIRQYDEDWNIWTEFPVPCTFLLSAIRQYDEDWNLVF